ncbi:MAG: response regulator [Deltaproteobacteria bacterium]|nr:response regulator [Deltaproteobacteria bacterium]
MFFESVLFWFAVCLNIITLGVIHAQPENRKSNLLKTYFSFYSCWLFIIFLSTASFIKISTGTLWLINTTFPVIITMIFFIFLKELLKISSKKLLYTSLIITTIQSLFIIIFYFTNFVLNITSSTDNQVISIGMNLLSPTLIIWFFAIYITFNQLKSFKRNSTRYGIKLFLSGMILSVFLGIFLRVLSLLSSNAFFLINYIPISGLMLTPFVIAALIKYNLLDIHITPVIDEIFKTSKDGLLLVTLKGNIQIMNSSAEKMFKTSIDAARDKNIATYIDGYFEQPGNASFKTFLKNSDNRFILVNISNSKRHLNGKFITIEDITDEDNANKLLTKTNEEFEQEIEERIVEISQLEEMKAIGKIASSVSHDFNNILAAVMGFTHVLKLELPKHHPAILDVETIMENANKAKELINHLLLFSIPETQTKCVLDVVNLVRKTETLLKPSIPQNIKMTLNLPDNEIWIMGREINLKQAILNLCTNAISAIEESKEDGHTIEISISTQPSCNYSIYKGVEITDSKSVEISVKDTGAGMDEEIMTLAFEPFFTTGEKNVGLGLPTVLRIATEHNGGVFLSSQNNTGSVAGIVLHILDENIIDFTSPEYSIVGGEHIMLVDDDTRILRMGDRLLTSLGYRVTTFEDPLDALSTFRSKPGDYDLLITDYLMPGLNGVDFAKKILDERNSIPILMISGNVNNEEIERAKDVGIRAFSRKNFEVTDLAQKIRRLLEDDKRISFAP